MKCGLAWASELLFEIFTRSGHSGRASGTIFESERDFHMGLRTGRSFPKIKNHDELSLTVDKDAETIVVSEPSPVGLGAVLLQNQADVPIVIGYFSRSLSSVEKRYCQTEKEALALVWVCEHSAYA